MKKFLEIVEKIENSLAFENFKEKNSDAELCAGFFVVDFIGKDNKAVLDYKVKEKIFSFDINENEEVTIKEEDIINAPGKPPLKKLNLELIKTELDELRGIAGIEALENGIVEKIQKIIAILQVYNGIETENVEKMVWNLTCMIEKLGILHLLIDSSNGSILKFEKKSMFDLIKRV